MKWRLKKGKYIMEKDGVFFSINPEQIPELQTVLNEIGADKGHAVLSNSTDGLERLLHLRPQITDVKHGAEPPLRDLILNYYKDHGMENYAELANKYIDELFAKSC